MKGKVPVNDDAGLEKEADVMGAKAVQMAAKDNDGMIQQKSASNDALAQLVADNNTIEDNEEEFGISSNQTLESVEESKQNKEETLNKDLEIIPKDKVKDTKNGDFLKNHFANKIRREKLVSGEKHGQGMAEQLARGGDGKNENINNFRAGEGKYEKNKDGKGWALEDPGFGIGDQGAEAAPEALSENLMDLVRLAKYDDTASASVLELANGGKDLKDDQMWNLIVVNSKFMSYIKEGMTVNKIIPDSTVENVLKIKQNDAQWGTSIGGSLAHEKNYDQGLTGEEATANFGLDYGGYKDGTLKSNGKEGAGGGNHSTYVFDTEADDKGRTLKAVPNVFYMKVAIPAVNLPDVKVPVHGNVKFWAQKKVFDIRSQMSGKELKKLADSSGASEGEMRDSLIKKLAILDLFINRSKVDANMLTTLTADKKKNKEDPLTNMGMTKPSTRLQTEFGTINQEYHTGYFPVPEGSGLWLKDATGVDTLVGEFIANPENSNTVEWGNLNEDLIGQKLTENGNLIAKK
jgi:hypothetical protein